MSQSINITLTYINDCFLLIFVMEAILKIIGLGPKTYFSDNEHIFDLTVVCSAILTSILSIIYHSDFGAATTFIRAVKLSKLFTKMKNAKHITVLFDTVTLTLPSLTNIGGLLLLFYYIYSVLGVFLFANI